MVWSVRLVNKQWVNCVNLLLYECQSTRIEAVTEKRPIFAKQRKLVQLEN